MRARLDGAWPIADLLVLVEDQTGRTRLVVLDFALANEVHLAVVGVAVEADMT